MTGGSCFSLLPQVGFGGPDAGVAEVDGSGSAQHRDGVADLLLLVVGERVELGLNAADELAQPVDFLVGGCCLGACPVVELGRGGDPFAVVQQLVQVGAQVWQVGRVGAEVVAAEAAEPEGAGVPGCLDVAGFGADTERNGDLADAHPGVFVVEECLGLLPEPVAVPVELVRHEPVDGGAGALLR